MAKDLYVIVYRNAKEELVFVIGDEALERDTNPPAGFEIVERHRVCDDFEDRQLVEAADNLAIALGDPVAFENLFLHFFKVGYRAKKSGT